MSTRELPNRVVLLDIADTNRAALAAFIAGGRALREQVLELVGRDALRLGRRVVPWHCEQYDARLVGGGGDAELDALAHVLGGGGIELGHREDEAQAV